MSSLTVRGTRELELGIDELRAIASSHQVPDVGQLVQGREGHAIRLAALAELAGVDPGASLVHVASEDGSFTANVALDEALAGGLVLYALDDEPLPRRYGGPFRLLFADGEDCSVNVKFLGQVEFTAEPGSHTARCSD